MGKVALPLHQFGHARGHAVGMLDDDPDLRTWRYLRTRLQIAGTDAIGMTPQRLQIAPQQAYPGIEAGADQQQDAQVRGDGHVQGHLHFAGKAQLQPASVSPLDGQQDLLVALTNDEAVPAQGAALFVIQCRRRIQQ
ncbi:hypothetical protein D3C71_1635170 [compost metagenome]